MDYTSSNAFATDAGTGNRLHQQSAAIPTAVTDQDMNGIIWELLSVIRGAGLTPLAFDKTVPSTYNQLYQAVQALVAAGSGSSVGFKNKVINGSMAVDQRNAGASQTFTAAAALAYSVDRWYGYCAGANITGQQVAGPIANTFRYQFTGATSNTGFGFGTRLEAVNTAPMAGATATLSAKLKSSSLTTITWTAYYATTKDSFGTLASPTRTQIATGNFTINATEAPYSALISLPSAATTGIEVVFTGGALVSGQTVTIGDVQLETGSSASTFDRRAYGQELALCQRYGLLVPIGGAAQVGWVASATANIGNLSVPFPVTMRAAPSIPTISWTLTQSSTPSVVHGSVNRVDWQLQGTVSSGSVSAANSAAFFLSAEL